MAAASSTRRPGRRISEASLAVVMATNAARATAGLGPLRIDHRLQRAARRRARHLADTGVLTHDGWDDAVDDAGYPEGARGENIATGQPDPGDVVADWLGSPGHRRNILGADFIHIGASWATDDDGRIWWVQCFGAGA